MPERKNSSSNKVFIHKNKVGHCTIMRIYFKNPNADIHNIFQPNSDYYFLFSYGFMCGIGCAMVRDTSGLMLGQYFKRRREIVEFLSTMGIGFGIAIFSNVYHMGLG